MPLIDFQTMLFLIALMLFIIPIFLAYEEILLKITEMKVVNVLPIEI